MSENKEVVIVEVDPRTLTDKEIMSLIGNHTQEQMMESIRTIQESINNGSSTSSEVLHSILSVNADWMLRQIQIVGDLKLEIRSAQNEWATREHSAVEQMEHSSKMKMALDEARTVKDLKRFLELALMATANTAMSFSGTMQDFHVRLVRIETMLNIGLASRNKKINRSEMN